MEPLTLDDLLDKNTYTTAREQIRRAVMHQKQQRRVHVGDHCTFLFENRDTLRYQVQEMLRAEDSWERPGALEEELESYNPLIPVNGELSATVLLEYETEEERVQILPQFIDIDQHVWLVIGDTPKVLATFDRGQINEQKISSVQYVKFALTAAQQELLATDGTVVRLQIDHPAYQAQAVLSEYTRKALASDSHD
jgi:hypothetical protein